ncbi:DUF6052 family protein [Streptomyces sp. NPDC101160]|uniref:DUF6052 family protein n=1 Tax=Streptomyces sp. NPDC101160 TaxID=3366118 RepID=UPI003829732E
MNGQAELTEAQERELLDCYGALLRIVETVRVPGVQSAARMALAEVHAAVEGQALEFDLYSRRFR